VEVNVLSDRCRTLSHSMGPIHATVGPVSQERFHIELTEANKISFTYVYLFSSFCAYYTHVGS
jgi:hypothetical protein